MSTANALPFPQARTPRVLLVFDDIDTVSRYGGSLRGAGFDVLLEMDFESAIVTAAVQLPDVIVLDVPQREKECRRFLQRAVNDARTNTIPVVLIADRADVAPQIRSRMLSLYPRWDAPNCLGAHLLRWFGAAHHIR